ncbi:hypothetical protein [Luteimonas sp. A478]
MLTVEDIREGMAAATKWRHFWIWHGVKLATFMVACGLVPICIGYLQGALVSPWAFMLPVLLAAIVAPTPTREVLHFSRMVAEFKSVERRASAGELVQASDVPSLGRRAAA